MDPQLSDAAAIAAGAPIVTGLVQVAKEAKLPDHLTNAAALVFGMAVSLLFVDDPTSRSAVLTGLATGLTATGIYEGIKQTAQVIRGTGD